MVKTKFLQRLILGKKLLQIVMLRKKKIILRRNCPPPTKIKRSVHKSIQKQIVEYDIKSKYPEEYSTVDKVGSEKTLASKSCFVLN